MRTKASIAAETERLRTVATQTEQSANAADAAGDHDTADTLFDSGQLTHAGCVHDQEGSHMTEISGLTSADAMRLLRHTLEQLETHLDDPDEHSLSGHGMLEVTRDRLSTLYALVVNLIPAPNDSRVTAACPRCTTCSEPIVWSESRQDWTHRNFVPVPHAVTTTEPATQDSDVPLMHYSDSIRGNAECGAAYRTIGPAAARGDDSTMFASEVTCPACVAAVRARVLGTTVPESAPVTAADDNLPRLLEVAEELAPLSDICRDLVGPRCGEVVDRARNARLLVREILSGQPAPATITGHDDALPFDPEPDLYTPSPAEIVD
jgi:hypothetical protein